MKNDKNKNFHIFTYLRTVTSRPFFIPIVIPSSRTSPIALTGVMVVTGLTAPNPHPTIPFVKPLIRKSVNPLTIGAICAIGATTIIPDIALRPYWRYCRYCRYSPYFPFLFPFLITSFVAINITLMLYLFVLLEEV